MQGDADPAGTDLPALARSLSRRQLLRRTGALGLALLLGEACGSTAHPTPVASRLATPAASLAPSATPGPSAAASLSAGALREVLGNVPATGALTLPGGKAAQIADLTAAGVAMAAAESASASIVTDPVAGLGFVLACADWSGKTGAIDLSSVLPGLPCTPARLVLGKLPGGKPTDLVVGATPEGLILHQGTALLPAGVLADGRVVAGVADPARKVAGHPRLELALLAPATLAPLLALAGAALPAGGTALALPGGTQVPLAPVDPALATRLVAGAGVLFVDQVPLQPAGATTPLLTAEPVVPAPDPAVVPGAVKVSQGTDGRILARSAAGVAVGRAEYIGGTPAWDWLGKDGLAWTLRELADRIGWRVGSEVTGYAYNNATWRGIMRDQFNQVTIDWGMSWGEIEPTAGEFSFSNAQAEVTWAATNSARVRGHALVFPSDLPQWVTARPLSATSAESILKRHVSSVVVEFKGAVAEWVVVNEPFLPPYRPSDPFHAALGDEYVDLAFSLARKADPSAVLIYADTDNHTSAGLTTALTQTTVSRLRAKGLVDAVGLEMHLDGANPPAEADVRETMRSYGLPVCVTEFDIDLTNVAGSTAQRYAVQARIAASMIRAARESGVCRSFTVWGIGDAYSWLLFAQGRKRADATPFDANLKPKPFFTALLDGLT